jgi:hypothetical protein
VIGKKLKIPFKKEECGDLVGYWSHRVEQHKMRFIGMLLKSGLGFNHTRNVRKRFKLMYYVSTVFSSGFL